MEKQQIVEKSKTLIDSFYRNHPKHKIVLLIIAGSHFFDLNTKNSDVDFRGIYLSEEGDTTKKGEITYKTNKDNNKKNNVEDVDCTFFSIHKFLDLLGSGDFNMMEMLFAPEDKILITSETYQDLVHIRESLLVNDVSSFLGFINKEAKRYGIDKNNYKTQEDFIKFLKGFSEKDTLEKHWDAILDYSKKEESYLKISSTINDNKELPAVVLTKRMFQWTVKISYVVEALQDNLSKCGHRRIKQAKEGVEFKGLYHAQRLLYEAEDLFKYGKLIFPFSKERQEDLLKIKEGKIDPELLFITIDQNILDIKKMEKNIISNKKTVLHLIEKLNMFYKGKFNLNKSFNLHSRYNLF